MDRQSVYSTHVFEPSQGESRDTRLQLQAQLETFILDFRLDNNFVYRCVVSEYRKEPRHTNPSLQRPAERECASQEVLLRCQHQRPDLFQ